MTSKDGFGFGEYTPEQLKEMEKNKWTQEKIEDAEWKFLRGGIHLKVGKKTLFHFQREGKKKVSNRYNVLWHIHRNLFTC